MKPTAVMINVGRGPVIDEAALLDALESKKIRGAALDVFETEPLPPDHPFYSLENVLLSPHSGRSFCRIEELARCNFSSKISSVFARASRSKTSWTNMPDTEVTFEHIRAAAERIRPIAKRTPVMTSRSFDAEAGVSRVLQMRESSKRRRVQDPRRVEFHFFDSERSAGEGRGGAFFGQSRAGGRDRRAIRRRGRRRW